jgi:sugar (pentulose or hexulose) kinase
MSNKRFLIFDLGASNGRSIVASVSDDRFELVETHRFDNGPILAMGTLYWDALYLFSEVKKGLLASRAQFGDIESLAVDTWGCDFGLIDGHGRLIGNPVAYRDVRRHERGDMLHEIMPEEELFSLAGTPLDRIMSIYQLFSFQYERAAEYEQARHFLMIPDLLNYMLTGEVSNEFTNATMSLMVDQTHRVWESQILDRFGFDHSWFSDLAEAGSTLGNVKRDIETELGVGTTKVVVPATHDTASAVSGIPVATGMAPGAWAFISMGTWCICGVETAAPFISEDARRAGFGNEGCPEGKNMLVRNLVGLWIIQECRDRWQKVGQRKVPWSEIVAATKAAAPFRSFIDVDDPRFGMVQADMPATVQAFCRETGQPVPGSMGEIARCVYESLAMKFRSVLGDLERLTGVPIEALHLVGGGIENQLLCQWTADAAGVPATAGPTETTSVGNLIFQMKNAGVVASVAEGREMCRSSFDLSHYEPDGSKNWAGEYAGFVETLKRKDG